MIPIFYIYIYKYNIPHIYSYYSLYYIIFILILYTYIDIYPNLITILLTCKLCPFTDKKTKAQVRNLHNLKLTAKNRTGFAS